MRDDVQALCDPRFVLVLALTLLPLIVLCGFILIEAS